MNPSIKAFLLFGSTFGFMLFLCCADINEKDASKKPSSKQESTTYPQLTEKAKILYRTYGKLSTIAGKGEIRGKGENGWLESYEGGKAVDAELSRPHFSMTDVDGNIFIADKDAHAIRKITTDGLIFTIAGTNKAGNGPDEGKGIETSLSSPNGLWVSNSGIVYILDLGNKKVRRLEGDGDISTLFSVSDGFGLGRGLWVQDDEQLAYVACTDHINKWTPSGGVTSFSDGFIGLGNLIVDTNGYLVVTDRGGHLVYRIDENGGKVVIAGNGETEGGGSGKPALESALNGVRGIWFLNDNSFFLATHAGSQVWYVDTDGILNLFLDGHPDHSHSGDGEAFNSSGYKISEVRAVSIDLKGNLIITESDFGFLRMVEKSGSE